MCNSSRLNILIRQELESDYDAIRRLLTEAFPTKAEADLVDRLRGNQKLVISSVAIDSDTDEVVGHIAFSPVTLSEPTVCAGLGLAPVVVKPDCQSRGVGRQLIESTLDSCRRSGTDFVVVLGEPGYYKRFGFAPASEFGLGNEYGVDDPFMVLELRPSCLKAATGVVSYATEFADLE
ncbi:MAG: GNAT family N-acetyltransferase [Planctomycetaceae bacterium]